jgi:hypothetical protein
MPVQDRTHISLLRADNEASMGKFVGIGGHPAAAGKVRPNPGLRVTKTILTRFRPDWDGRGC